jgi:hypothetical protein
LQSDFCGDPPAERDTVRAQTAGPIALESERGAPGRSAGYELNIFLAAARISDNVSTLGRVRLPDSDTKMRTVIIMKSGGR